MITKEENYKYPPFFNYHKTMIFGRTQRLVSEKKIDKDKNRGVN